MANKDNSLRIVQRDKFKEQFQIKEFKWEDFQTNVINQLLDTKNSIILLSGPSGCSKTLLSVLAGLKYLQEKRVSQLVYTRTIIESASKSLGSLPGEDWQKFRPFSIPLEEKLEELLSQSDINKLFKDDRIKTIPINYLRGCQFNASFIIADEIQNWSWKETITLLTRAGRFTKIILAGDLTQSDLNGKSGFKQILETFDDQDSRNHGIITIHLGKEHIMRSEIVRFIVEKLEKSVLDNREKEIYAGPKKL